MVKKITHIIIGLGNGGAESMLYKLLQETDKTKYDVKVISLTNNVYYKEKIEKLGFKVYICNLKSKAFLLSLVKCFRICKNTDVIQTWMYHSNIIGYLIAKLYKKRIIWGLHHSNLDVERNKRRTILIAKLGAFFSNNVDVIVSCGHKVRDIHMKLGYSEKNHRVIYNGFNTDNFFPTIKNKYYSENFDVNENLKILLHVGRWNPLKDYNNLLMAINDLKTKFNNFKIFLVGNQLNKENYELISLINKLNIEEYVIPLGSRDDIPQLMSGANVFVLSSAGEGLPNVLGEALASGTCCVTTDVGDCRALVKDFGEIVPAQNFMELSKGIETVLKYTSLCYETKAMMGREHIINNFEIKKISAEYFKLY